MLDAFASPGLQIVHASKGSKIIATELALGLLHLDLPALERLPETS